MLPTDLYLGDPASVFFPDFSTLSYLNHIGQSKPYYKYIFNNDQLARWNERVYETNVLPSILFFSSLIPIIFHKKIPKLKNFTTKKARFGFAILFLSIPIGLGAYFSNKFQQEVLRSYQFNEADFKKYRMTGDFKKINEKIRILDI